MGDFELWLEFEHWIPEPSDDPENDCFNMQIRFPDGRKYALSVSTFAFLETEHREARESGDNLGGRYLDPPDLLVERLDRALLEEVVRDLIREGCATSGW